MMNIPHLPSDFFPLASSFCRSGFIVHQSAISAIAFLPTELIITNDLHKLSIFAILYDIIWQNFLRRKNSYFCADLYGFEFFAAIRERRLNEKSTKEHNLIGYSADYIVGSGCMLFLQA